MFRQLRITFFHKIMLTEKSFLIFQIPPPPGEVIKIYSLLPPLKAGGPNYEMVVG